MHISCSEKSLAVMNSQQNHRCGALPVPCAGEGLEFRFPREVRDWSRKTDVCHSDGAQRAEVQRGQCGSLKGRCLVRRASEAVQGTGLVREEVTFHKDSFEAPSCLQQNHCQQEKTGTEWAGHVGSRAPRRLVSPLRTPALLTTGTLC